MSVSLLGHVVTVGGFSGGFHCIPEFEMPEIELEFTEIELLDPDAVQGDQPDPEPEPPPAPEPETPPPPPPTPEDPAAEDKKPEPEPEPEPKPEPVKKMYASKGSRADKLAPPTSTFYMLLVPKRIRRLPFKQQVLDIMAPLPDFEMLIDKGRFDALKDFDHIVIASPDIRDWTQTFLAVDYKISREEVKRSVERAVAANGDVIEWVDDGTLLRGNPRPADPKAIDPDNRWFVFLEDSVAVYVREEFLPSILSGPDSDDRKTTGNFVASLTKLRRFAARQPGSGVQLVYKELYRSLKISNLPFKVPDSLELSASANKNPKLMIRGEFINVVEAKAFMKWYSDTLGTLIDSNFTIKLTFGAVYEQMELTRDGKTVTLRTELTSGQAQEIMKYLAQGSREIAGKTPEEVAEMKRRRVEAIKARKGGKLPPSALDPQAEDPPGSTEPQPSQKQPRRPRLPGPLRGRLPTKPTKTPSKPAIDDGKAG